MAARGDTLESFEGTEAAPNVATLRRAGQASRTIIEMLEAARAYLDAELAYVGEFKDQRQVVRWLSGDNTSFGIRAGSSVAMADTYCRELIAGRIPAIIPDTSKDPVVALLQTTHAAGIGSYAGELVPRHDGSTYGTLCVISHEPNPELGERHERFLAILARLVGEQIAIEEQDIVSRREMIERIHRVINASNGLKIVHQPIVDLDNGVVAGYEALSRFADGRPPDRHFHEAWSVGRGLELELATVRAALSAIDRLPEGTYLSINASPSVVLSDAFLHLVEEEGSGRIVIELTEHEQVEDYQALRRALDALRSRGIRVAVDDVGAGFASLRHVLMLDPDILKLDVALTRGVEVDRAQAALASLLVSFAARIGASVVAEGIETERQRDALRLLGVRLGQGFLLGAPSEAGFARHIDLEAMRSQRVLRAVGSHHR